MSVKRTEDFEQEVIWIASTSGFSRRRDAADLGVGLSTLGKWVSQYRPTDLVSAPQPDLAREIERLRLENLILKPERKIPKNCLGFGPTMRGRNGLWYGSGRGSGPIAFGRMMPR